MGILLGLAALVFAFFAGTAVLLLALNHWGTNYGLCYS